MQAVSNSLQSNYVIQTWMVGFDFNAGVSKKVDTFGGLWNQKCVTDSQNYMLIISQKLTYVRQFCLVKPHIFRTQKLEKCL